MKKPSHVDIEFDRETFDTIVRVFTKMIENREDIDFSRYDLAPFEEFIALMEKLKSFQGAKSSVVTIPMTRDDWSVYKPYVKHANDIDLEYEESELMGDLSLKYTMWHADGTIRVD